MPPPYTPLHNMRRHPLVMRIRKSYSLQAITLLITFIFVVIIYNWYKIIDGDYRTLQIRTRFSTTNSISVYQRPDELIRHYESVTGERDDAIALKVAPSRRSATLAPPKLPEIVLAVVACGMRLPETLNMLKSVMVFNVDRRALRIVVITEPELQQSFQEKLEDWQALTHNMFVFEVRPLSFPEENTAEWRNLFKPCAAQRLFLPVNSSPGAYFMVLVADCALRKTLLAHIDSVLYVDTDTIFLSPVSRIWSLFERFNATQIAGLSPEHEDKNVGWYNRFARHPFYGPLGVNSGVMLMNLTRMREFRWVDYILPLHKEYKLKITWGDQDLINILFHFHPDKLYVFPCEWNYRPDHCMYMAVCKAPDGVQILHGNRGYFHAGLQPAFSVTYRVMEQFRLGTDAYRNVLLPLESALADDAVMQTNCGHTVDRMLVVPRQVLKETDYYYNEVQ